MTTATGAPASRNEMWDLLNQLFGISGLVATILEFIYINTNANSFTAFEYLFFWCVSLTEMGGETYLLVVGLWLLRSFSCSPKLLTAMIKDPVHILAGAKFTESVSDEENELTKMALGALFMSWVSVYFWVIFWPVWDRRFTGDEGLRFALSVVSLVLVLSLLCIRYLTGSPFIRGITHQDYSSTKFNLFVSIISLIYSMEKVFEVYILLSNKERLITGIVGEMLVGLQAAEIFSLATFLFHIWVPVNSSTSHSIQEQDGPQRGVLRQRNDATV